MSLGPPPRLLVENVDGVLVVSFTDTKIVTEDQIQEVGEQLYAIAEDAGKKKILLNFGNVQYCSVDRAGQARGFQEAGRCREGEAEALLHPSRPA